MNSIFPERSKAIARFVIQRVPDVGYRVTSSDGTAAASLKQHAITILDMLGQPEPNASNVAVQWIGPVGESDAWVGVETRLLQNGDAEYYQHWFDAPKKQSSLQIRLYRSGIVFVSGVLIGVLLTATFLSGDSKPSETVNDDQSVASTSAQALTEVTPLNTSTASPNDGNKLDQRSLQCYERLQSQLASDRELRQRLIDYLSQPGFAPEPTLPVAERSRAIKLISDLDRSAPAVESIMLSNLDVQELLKLLRCIAECDEESLLHDKSAEK